MHVYPGFGRDFHKLQSAASTLPLVSAAILRDVDTEPNTWYIKLEVVTCHDVAITSTIN